MEFQPPPFFNRGPAPLVRLTFFISLAMLLMVLDVRFHYLEALRTGLAMVVYPLQRVFTDDELRARMGGAGLAFCRAHQGAASKTLVLCERLIGSSHNRAGDSVSGTPV